MPQNNSTDLDLILFKNHVGYSRLTFPIPNFPRKSIKPVRRIGAKTNGPARAGFKIQIRQRQRHGKDIFSHENLRAFPFPRLGWWAPEGSCPYCSCLMSKAGSVWTFNLVTHMCIYRRASDYLHPLPSATAHTVFRLVGNEILASLDLSADFDTIDHHTLIQRLETSFGVSATALWWLSSYLIGRQHSVRVGVPSSPFLVCNAGVTQGSVLGPVVFNIYTSPVSTICSSLGIPQKQSDDTQLFIALSPTSISVEVSKLTLCLTSLHSWFSQSALALNADRYESILLGIHVSTHNNIVTSHTSMLLTPMCLSPTMSSCSEWRSTVVLRSTNTYVLSKTCFYHIRAFRHIRPAINEDMAKLVACSL